MCGRTSLFAPPEAVEERFDVAIDRPWPARYNVGPGDWLATVPAAGRVERLTWGFVPRWSQTPEGGPRPINARRETLDSASPFRASYADRRCLVVVDGYYEWVDAPHGRQPIRFERRDRDPFALAGLWDRWSANGETLDTVAVVTASATDAVRDVHDRMPVVLNPGAEADWLHGDPEQPTEWSVLDPSLDESFRQYPVDPMMNDGTVDEPGVIEPVGDTGQRTLGEY